MFGVGGVEREGLRLDCEKGCVRLGEDVCAAGDGWLVEILDGPWEGLRRGSYVWVGALLAYCHLVKYNKHQPPVLRRIEENSEAVQRGE